MKNKREFVIENNGPYDAEVRWKNMGFEGHTITILKPGQKIKAQTTEEVFAKGIKGKCDIRVTEVKV